MTDVCENKVIRHEVMVTDYHSANVQHNWDSSLNLKRGIDPHVLLKDFVAEKEGNDPSALC
jgi:hypothetical protein